MYIYAYIDRIYAYMYTKAITYRYKLTYIYILCRHMYTKIYIHTLIYVHMYTQMYSAYVDIALYICRCAY